MSACPSIISSTCLLTATEGLALDAINSSSSFFPVWGGQQIVGSSIHHPCIFSSVIDIWLQGVAIILPQIQRELVPVRVEYATLALYAGLIVGASVWGVLADLIGRRLSFNITLFIAAVFGIAAGAANDFTTIASLIACLGFGVGGK